MKSKKIVISISISLFFSTMMAMELTDIHEKQDLPKLIQKGDCPAVTTFLESYSYSRRELREALDLGNEELEASFPDRGRPEIPQIIDLLESALEKLNARLQQLTDAKWAPDKNKVTQIIHQMISERTLDSSDFVYTLSIDDVEPTILPLVMQNLQCADRGLWLKRYIAGNGPRAERVQQVVSLQPDLIHTFGGDLLFNAVNQNFTFRNFDSAEQYKITQLLLDAGAPVNAKGSGYFVPIGETSRTYTPLLSAASRGDAEIIALLLKHGAEINYQDEAGDTVLIKAVQAKKYWTYEKFVRTDAVRVLLKAGANPKKCNNAGKNAFDIARDQKDETMITVLRQFNTSKKR